MLPGLMRTQAAPASAAPSAIRVEGMSAIRGTGVAEDLFEALGDWPVTESGTRSAPAASGRDLLAVDSTSESVVGHGLDGHWEPPIGTLPITIWRLGSGVPVPLPLSSHSDDAHGPFSGKSCP